MKKKTFHTYNGTTKLAEPTASPITLRPTIIKLTVLVHVCKIDPSTKSNEAKRITLFRPILSAKRAASGLAINAKKAVLAVIRLRSSVPSFRADRSVPMLTSVEEMMPVLYMIAC